MIQVDTKNILFIVGGAFDGIEEIVKQRLGEKVIGFGQNNKAIDENSSASLSNTKTNLTKDHGTA